jgi:hypothetical protein
MGFAPAMARLMSFGSSRRTCQELRGRRKRAITPYRSPTVYRSERSGRITAYRRLDQRSGVTLLSFLLFNTWGLCMRRPFTSAGGTPHMLP